MESRGVEEITCERVKGLNKRTGHRGRDGGGGTKGQGGRVGGERRPLEEDRIQGSREVKGGRCERAKPRGETYKSIGDSPTIRTGK